MASSTRLFTVRGLFAPGLTWVTAWCLGAILLSGCGGESALESAPGPSGMGEAASAPPAGPYTDLDLAIDASIRLLEAGDNATVLRSLVSPENLEHVLSRKSFDEFVEDFTYDSAHSLLVLLRSIQSTEPIYNEDQSLAVYQLDPVIAAGYIGRDEIVFSRIGEFWYLNND